MFPYMMKSIILLTILTQVLVFSSCSSCNNSSKNFDIPDSILNTEDQPMEVSDATIDNIVQNIASPVEMAALIKSIGVPYSKQYLASTDNVENYASSFTKALNLGIYGADLGYINMYNKSGAVLDYITAIKSLADDINIGQFFDFQTLKRLASNSSNLDSLMYISVHSFNKMDDYLRKNKRANLSALMIAGVWVEGLYLGTQVVKANPSEKLVQTIGEQKTILNQLMLLLEIYKKDKFIADLIKEYKILKHEFDNVKITIEVGEPESVIKDGRLTIIQNEKSIVHMSDEQLKVIINQAEAVRNRVISWK